METPLGEELLEELLNNFWNIRIITEDIPIVWECIRVIEGHYGIATYIYPMKIA